MKCPTDLTACLTTRTCRPNQPPLCFALPGPENLFEPSHLCGGRGVNMRLNPDGASAVFVIRTVTVQRRGTAQMDVEHPGPVREKPLSDQINHALH